MKTRNSLVSNSSSSSFIVAYKPSDKCKCCGRGDPDLKQIIDDKGSYNDNNQVYAIGKDNIIKHIAKEWTEFDSVEMKEIVDKINKLDDGYILIYCSVSHHDSDLISRIEDTNKIIYRGEY